MQNFSKNIALWLIIGILLIALFNLFQGTSTNQVNSSISFSDFISAVESGNVSEVQIQGDNVEGFFIDSGARHFVCESKVFNDIYIYKTGQLIRNAEYFQPKGINVNFYEILDKNNIKIKTYEKGVEKVMFYEAFCGGGTAQGEQQ